MIKCYNDIYFQVRDMRMVTIEETQRESGHMTCTETEGVLAEGEGIIWFQGL